ncbi:MAG: acyltransferase [Bilifractor sp.]|jgi:acetyltransferase-like isoleucine patch superfamily enzyme
MECEEIIVDTRDYSPEERKEGDRINHLLFQLNQTEASTPEYRKLLKELFGDRIGEDSYVAPGLHGAALDRVRIGKGVLVNSNALLMARGGITIEDHAMIAADASIITNNHDPYDREVLPCRPVLIREGAWVGAHAIVLPGVCIGRYAIVGAGSVVTKDVPDYGVAVGNPAHVIRMLDPDKFPEETK